MKIKVGIEHLPEELASIVKPLWDKLSEDAKVFLIEFCAYVELADDLVDEDFSKEARVAFLAQSAKLFQTNFWLKSGTYFVLLERVIALTYTDVVAMEDSTVEWHRVDAKALSHCAYNMFYAVLIFELGFTATQTISLPYRLYAHEKHLTDK